MNASAPRTNPFVLMLDPESVISAVERSLPLRGLRGRVCRPLDKPLIPKLFDSTIQEFDSAIDEENYLDSAHGALAEAQPGLIALH